MAHEKRRINKTMTLGQKLAGYRRLSGMTQQQLGDYLNISPQAISKWEKDLSEPALATLRVLSELYKVSVDEILDLKSGFPDISVLSDNEDKTDKENSQTATIGFCKDCGIAVTEVNLGATQPVVLCKSCLEAKEAKQKAAADAERLRLQQEAIREENIKRTEKAHRRNHLIWSLSVASIAAIIVASILIADMVGNFSVSSLVGALIFTYVIFSFVSCLFYECVVQDLVADWFSKSINLPGLIFSFDLDGIIWLIGMKLLFWVIGLLFGIICAIIGIILALICAPFVFPFVMRNVKRGTA